MIAPMPSGPDPAGRIPSSPRPGAPRIGDMQGTISDEGGRVCTLAVRFNATSALLAPRIFGAPAISPPPLAAVRRRD